MAVGVIWAPHVAPSPPASTAATVATVRPGGRTETVQYTSVGHFVSPVRHMALCEHRVVVVVLHSMLHYAPLVTITADSGGSVHFWIVSLGPRWWW